MELRAHSQILCEPGSTQEAVAQLEVERQRSTFAASEYCGGTAMERLLHRTQKLLRVSELRVVLGSAVAQPGALRRDVPVEAGLGSQTPEPAFFMSAPLASKIGVVLGVLYARDANRREPFSDYERQVFQDTQALVQELLQGEIARRHAEEHGPPAGLVDEGTYGKPSELRILQRRLGFVLKSLGVGLWECELPFGPMRWSDEQRALFGLNAGSPVPTHDEWLAMLHPEDRTRVIAALDAAQWENKPYEEEYRIVLADGTERWLHARAVNLQSDDQNVRYFLGMSMDVTAQKQVQYSLMESEARYRMLADNIDDMVSLHDLNGNFLYASPSYCEKTGYTIRELVGRSAYDHTFEEDEVVVHRLLQSSRDSGSSQAQWRCRMRSGQLLWLETRASTVLDVNGEPETIIWVSRTIEERLSLEEQVRQAQKMEAVGKLAGGMAHDFNNLLTVIHGYAELLLASCRYEDPMRPYLAQILEAGQHAAALIQQLLAFSRKQVLQPRVLQLNQVSESMIPMLERLIPATITFETNLAPAMRAVKADPTQLEQVVLNLILNARDAMPRGGRLTLSTRMLHVRERIVAGLREELEPGWHAVLEIADEGHGIPVELRNKIFEPFFTTRPRGEGTGLGLSTAYGIVKQSGGALWYESEPAGGTRFFVALPAIAQPNVTREELVSAERQTGALSDVVIVLVEDEDRVRGLIAELLRTAGYRVLTARDGLEGLATCRNFSGRIDLLITDVIMPNAGGEELVREILPTRPGLKVLFMSGYAAMGEEGIGILESGTYPLLAKPFPPHVLLQRVRDLLEEGRRNRSAQS